MKYNIGYHYLSQATTVDPTPMTVEGTRSLVERFYVLRRQGWLSRGQVGVGGYLEGDSVTSLGSLPTKKTKRLSNYGYYGPMK